MSDLISKRTRPHQSTLRFLGPERGFTEIVRPGLDAYFGLCFERLCRESLPLIYMAEGITAAFAVGEYWDPDVQIDVVGIRRDNWTDLGECKWRSVSSLSILAAEIEDMRATIPMLATPQSAGVFSSSHAKPRRPSYRRACAYIRWMSYTDHYCA